MVVVVHVTRYNLLLKAIWPGMYDYYYDNDDDYRWRDYKFKKKKKVTPLSPSQQASQPANQLTNLEIIRLYHHHCRYDQKKNSDH